MTITFPVYQLASFDEEKAAWILEGGTYGIWVGSSIQDAEPAGSLCLNKDAVLVQCEHICPLKEELKELTPDHGRMMEKEAAWLEKTAGLPCVHMSAENIGKEIVVYSELPEHFTGRAGEIVESLSREQLVPETREKARMLYSVQQGSLCRELRLRPPPLRPGNPGICRPWLWQTALQGCA